MQSKHAKDGKRKFILTRTWRFVVGSILWVVLISGLHWWLNFDHGHRKVVKMGYMPVITNMAAPLLDYASAEGEDVRFKL